MSNRYIVLDPGFEHKDSHHQVVNDLIARSAPENEKVIIVAGKNYCGDTQIAKADIISFFAINLYPENYHNLKQSVYESMVRALSQSFRELFESLELDSGDNLIVHTAFSYVYEGLARALHASKIEGVSVYVSTMFSPGKIVEFGKEKSQNIREFMRHKLSFAIFKILEDKQRINFCIESPTQMYLDAYQTMWPEKSMSLHPSVCGGGQEITKGNTRKVLAYLGGPKWDKGIEFTIEAVCQLSLLFPNFQFVFHYNDDFPGAEAYLTLIEKLGTIHSENIEIIKGNIDKERYELLLSSASCYFLLYDPSHYKYKTSGVLWDALRHAQGKSIIVCNDTWHERELIQIGATFNSVDYGDVDSLINLFRSQEIGCINRNVYNNSYVSTLLDDFGVRLFEALNKSKNKAIKIKKILNTRKILVVRTDYGHFTKLSGPGGFVKYLPSLGYDVEEVLIPLGHDKTKFHDDGKRWVLLEAASRHLASYQINAFETEQKILTQFQKYDVIHFVDGEHAGLMVALARLKGAITKGPKVIATFHQPDYVIKDLVVNAKFLNGFDKIQLMSPCQKQSFIELGVEDSRLVVVPHGVSHEHFKPALSFDIAEEALDEIYRLQEIFLAKKIIIAVGNWLRDYEIFLEVARSFRDDLDVIFVAVSRGLELSLNKDDTNIILLNSGISDRALHWLYRKCELMFLPLKGGAANNAILEAVAANTKIITSDLLSTRFYTGGSAEFCTTFNEFREALINSYSSGKTKKRIYDVDFSWETVASKMCDELYE